MILVDPPAWPAHGRRWSHLVSDTSYTELHTFARRLGIPERGFEGDHYDIPEERYADVVRAGAVPVSSRELLKRLQLSGLRRPKRRGERVIASIETEQGRVDALWSSREPLGRVVAVVVVARRGPDILVLPDDDGLLLPRARLPHGTEDAAVAVAALEPYLPGHADLGTVVRLGYLRRVGPAGPHSGTVDAILAWEAGRPAHGLDGGPVVPRPPSQWTDAGQASALLPPLLAPFARPHPFPSHG